MTTKDDKILARIRETEATGRSIGALGVSFRVEDIAWLLERLDEANAEIKRQKRDAECRGLHTCHDECQNRICLMRKENALFKTQLDVAVGALGKAEQALGLALLGLRGQAQIDIAAVENCRAEIAKLGEKK